MGCDYCYPAVAADLLSDTCLDGEDKPLGPPPRKGTWPAVPGEYFVNPYNRHCHVAVTTLASPDLARRVGTAQPDHLCMVGKTETENIGIEKLVKNIITNPSIHFLIVAGAEPKGHKSGATLLSLFEHGIDESGRVQGPAGRDPVLPNLSPAEVEAFRHQVRVTDMRECQDPQRIGAEAKSLVASRNFWCGTGGFAAQVGLVAISGTEVVQARRHPRVSLDPAGYFVVLRDVGRKFLIVEFYSHEHHLLHAIEGRSARDLYLTAIANGWVGTPTRAACLGHELGNAECSLRLGTPYIQEGA